MALPEAARAAAVSGRPIDEGDNGWEAASPAAADQLPTAVVVGGGASSHPLAVAPTPLPLLPPPLLPAVAVAPPPGATEPAAAPAAAPASIVGALCFLVLLELLLFDLPVVEDCAPFLSGAFSLLETSFQTHVDASSRTIFDVATEAIGSPAGEFES